jgi:hypothetical protein
MTRVTSRPTDAAPFDSKSKFNGPPVFVCGPPLAHEGQTPDRATRQSSRNPRTSSK